MESIRSQFATEAGFSGSTFSRPCARRSTASGRRRRPRTRPCATGLRQGRPGRGRADGQRPHPDRRLAVSLPARADDPRPQPARHGDRRRALAGRSCLRLLPVRRARPSGRMFFLGAGFMLLETKGVVHMALLFRRDVDGQLDRLLRDPDHDPAGEPLRAGGTAAPALAVLRAPSGRAAS